MALPLDSLLVGDSISLFRGPQIGVNYVGSQSALCTVVLDGTATLTIQSNITPLSLDGNTVPNPNSWVSVRDIISAGTVEVPLIPRPAINWIRIIIRTVGTGTGTVTATWQTLGSVIDPFIFLGYWDATANSPALTSGIGPNGGYYIVQVAGSTALDGISSWIIGDIVAFNRTAWIKQLTGVSVQNP